MAVLDYVTENNYPRSWDSYGNNDNERLVKAINDANGGTVYLPERDLYLSLDMTLSQVDSVHLVGVPGKTVIKTIPSDDGLEFRATFSPAYTVSALSSVTDGSASGSDDTISRLTITGGVSAFSEGQICKIYSEDASYYGDANSKNYAGELFEVRGVDAGNNYVFVKGLLALHASYSTSIKVRILDKKKVTLENIEFDIDDSIYGIYDDSITVRSSALKLWGIHEPTLKNVVVRKAWGQGINLIACWMPDCDVRTDWVINGTDSAWSPGVDALGYGISATTCFGGHIKLMAEGCRHAFTTLHPEDSAFDARRWIEYGETVGTRISGTAVNCEGAAFDTHESGIDLQFENCFALNSTRGDYGTIRGKGFNNRARGTRYINCRSVGGSISFLNTGVDHGAKHTVIYDSCVANDATYASQASWYVEGSTNAPRVILNNCSSTGGYRIIEVSGGVAIVNGGTYVIAGDWFGRVLTGAEILVHGALVDFTNSTALEALIRMQGTSSATVTSTHIIEGATRCTGVFHDEDNTGSKTCKYGAVTATGGALATSAAGSASVLTPTNILLA